MSKLTSKLTPTQVRYLRTIRQRSALHAGWGGYKSTLTVRILAERRLIRLKQYGPGDWVARLTDKGAALLGSLEERQIIPVEES